MTRRKAQQRGGRTTALDPLAKARKAARQATREAQRDPGDHEKLTRAFALQATVKHLEAVVGEPPR